LATSSALLLANLHGLLCLGRAGGGQLALRIELLLMADGTEVGMSQVAPNTSV
jgi:hypothetical protein